MPLLPEPTDDQLRAAWYRLRRPEWGNATFDGDQDAAARMARVRLEARRPRGTCPVAPSPVAAAPQAAPAASGGHRRPPAAPPVAQQPPRRSTAPDLHFVDLKRAAAGDRDDDDDTPTFP